jgi:transposase-like protein
VAASTDASTLPLAAISLGELDEKVEGSVGSWFLWYRRDAQDVRVRVADRGGRIVIEALHVEAVAGSTLTSADLRPLQLSRLDAVLNGPEASSLVREVLARKGPASHRPGRAQGRRLAWAGSSQKLDETLADLRRSGRMADERRAELRQDADARGRRPDEFYKRVAEEVARAAAITRSPAVEVATDLDVPVSTVHRWMREARRRGIISAPGRTTSRSEVMAAMERIVREEEYQP